MLITNHKRILRIILVGLALFLVPIIAHAEGGSFQETTRISAYAVAAEGEYVYILGDAVNLEGELPEGSLNLGGGMRDIWLVKMQLDGTPVFQALLGGADDDSAYSLTVREGVVYILGETWSRDFPGAPGCAGENDALLLALAADGSQILWARRFGGSDQDAGRALTLQDGSLYLTGITWSGDLLPGGALGNADGFLARVGLDGRLDWLKIFGGSALDAPFDLMVSEDSLWIAGQSLSRDFGGTHQGEGDAFAARFSLAGEQQFARLYGGREADIAYALSPAGNGGILLGGATRSDSLPDARGEFGGNYDGFVMNITADGTMQAVSYIGGTGADYVYDIELLSGGDVLVVGETYSPAFPLGYDTFHGGFGEGDAFIVHLDPGGDVISSWLIGGNEDDRARSMVLTAQGLWMAGAFNIDSFSYDLLVPLSALEGVPFPNPEPILPTATLAPTGTPRPTETPRPTNTATQQPTTPLTATADTEHTATEMVLEAKPASSSETLDPTKALAFTRTAEIAETLGLPLDESEQGTSAFTMTPTADSIMQSSSTTSPPSDGQPGGISTGLVIGAGLLLAAILGGGFYWYRRRKIENDVDG